MIILLFAGGFNAYNPATIMPTGVLTKEISRNLVATLTPTGIRWNNVYDIGTVTGTITPAGVLTKLVKINKAGALTSSATLVARGGGSAVWQLDENVGYSLVYSKEGTFQTDEDVLSLTGVACRDGLLQADENVLVKAAPPVTSY